VLYNIGTRTGRHLSAAGVLEAAQHPNVSGIKQASTALDLDTLELLSGAAPDFAVLGGEDTFLFPLVLMGGAGAICASAHVCTERFVSMIECGLAQKVEEGRAHAEALLPVVKSLFVEPNPAVFKGVLHAQGKISTPDVRMPLANASAAAVERCLGAVANASH
jgi:4-hydroxy-tetrahydrodipicolinate synthase